MGRSRNWFLIISYKLIAVGQTKTDDFVESFDLSVVVMVRVI